MFHSQKRAVSRERVIGISFVDILIQVTFLLLLALMVGYVDPKQQAEVTSVGLDACNKLNRPSTKPCSEVLPQFLDQLSSRCRELGAKSPEDCMDRLKEAAEALKAAEDSGNVAFCLKTRSRLQKPLPSVRFKVPRPGEIYFSNFDPSYIEYLVSNTKTDKLRLVEEIKRDPQRVYTAEDIPNVFGFIRENSCRMVVFAEKTGSFPDAQLELERTAVYRLQEPLKRN